MSIRTVGYIVCDNGGRALVWNEKAGRFYFFGGGTASLYAMDDYEGARQDVGRHYRELNRSIDGSGNVAKAVGANRPFMKLKITSLRSR